MIGTVDDTTTRWLHRNRAKAQPATVEVVHAAAGAPPFRCSTCGRTDLPETGGWDPPICQECDAAINEDAIRDEEVWENEA